jgi:hypothetical protein
MNTQHWLVELSGVLVHALLFSGWCAAPLARTHSPLHHIVPARQRDPHLQGRICSSMLRSLEYVPEAGSDPRITSTANAHRA